MIEVRPNQSFSQTSNTYLFLTLPWNFYKEMTCVDNDQRDTQIKNPKEKYKTGIEK